MHAAMLSTDRTPCVTPASAQPPAMPAMSVLQAAAQVPIIPLQPVSPLQPAASIAMASHPTTPGVVAPVPSAASAVLSAPNEEVRAAEKLKLRLKVSVTINSVCVFQISRF